MAKTIFILLLIFFITSQGHCKRNGPQKLAMRSSCQPPAATCSPQIDRYRFLSNFVNTMQNKSIIFASIVNSCQFFFLLIWFGVWHWGRDCKGRGRAVTAYVIAAVCSGMKGGVIHAYVG